MKAIALVSGGLDGILAARLMQKSGIEVILVYFNIPFHQKEKALFSNAKDKIAIINSNLGREAVIVDISTDFFALLLNPKHGYGSNMNPCIDCKILMLKKAKELMLQQEASFIVTGEVLGQRPMSQTKRNFLIMDKECGLEGLVLRPLSAQLLPKTIPEEQGWVNKDFLLDFNSRSRKPQLALAEKFKISDYLAAGGGCLLTEPEFIKKIKDLISHGELNTDNVELLKTGRHFRISETAKLIVGRDERENKELENAAKENDFLFIPPGNVAGPTSLARGILNEDLIRLCCSITCYYCNNKDKSILKIGFKKIQAGEENILEVNPLENKILSGMRI
ncbi:MAG: tRNA 4-thiouridine(8) synthase ThiI [Candidatus Omnitrophota bacterium]